MRDRHERDLELGELLLEVGELAQLEVDAARRAVVRLVVAEREDVQDDEREVHVLRDGRGVRQRRVVVEAQVLVAAGYDEVGISSEKGDSESENERQRERGTHRLQ